MEKIKFIVDSSVDLLDSFYKEEDIDVLHYSINMNGKIYRDGIDVTMKELYEEIDNNHKLPKTSAVTPYEFSECFAKFSKEYDSVIFIGLGSGFSSAYNNAKNAASEFDNVYTIDSQNLSGGTGLLVLKMCKLRKEGKSAKEIVKEIEETVPYVRCSFAINTLEYLYMGGRCKGIARFIGTVLMLKPIIRVNNNAMEVAKKPIGYNKALKVMLDEIMENKDNIDMDNILITHSDAKKDAKFLIEKLSENFDPSILHETFASATISTHCGPRTIGILYILKH